MSYPDTNIREQNNEITLLRRKSARDDCSIERLQSSNDCQAREIDRMQHQMDQMHDERMAQGQHTTRNTINNYHAPVFCNGGTLAGNVINKKKNERRYHQQLQCAHHPEWWHAQWRHCQPNV